MLFPILVALFAQFQGLNGQTVDAFGVSLADKVEAMELHLLSPGSIDFGVSPCSNLLLDSPFKGEQTAAEWVRIVFHDAITFDKTTGLGGLDASIGFAEERDRPENVGAIFIDRTISDFAIHSSIYRSISDVIGLGMAASLLSCDPTQPMIKLRAGRIDATGPGPAGVPGPFDSVDVALAAFVKANFTKTEMIQAVACGHSIGSVHRANFPDIIGDDVPTVGDDGAASFDTTPFVFDNKVVTEYLDNNTTNPLVVGKNVSARSDFRIFNSETNNQTMNALRPAATFRSTCFTVFEKLLNTVPSTVHLSDPLFPRQWLLREGHLDLDSTNAVRYIGVITTHNKTATGAIVAPPTKANWFFGTTGGGNTGTQQSSNGVVHAASQVASTLTTAFGLITDYSFNQTLNSPSITSFNIAAAAAPTTALYSTPINPNVFILFSRTFQQFSGSSANFKIRAAALSTLATTGTSVLATLYYPADQANTESPKYVKVSQTMTLLTVVRGSYKTYETFLTTDQPIGVGAFHIDVRLVSATGTTLQTGSKILGGNLNACTESVFTNC